jgi:hypothetical protein
MARQVAVDAFGNALGNGLANAASSEQRGREALYLESIDREDTERGQAMLANAAAASNSGLSPLRGSTFTEDVGARIAAMGLPSRSTGASGSSAFDGFIQYSADKTLVGTSSIGDVACGYGAKTRSDVSPGIGVASVERRLLQPGEAVRGNLFFGGAGMDGGYINDMVRAFGDRGIELTPVDRQKWSGGTALDASLGVNAYRDGKFPAPVLLDNFQQSGPQFNLIGYSYGSVAAAQVAINYAEAGTKVDNLVLIGSPISKEFLNDLRSTQNIRNVLIVDLTERGDPIYAGMTRGELMMATPSLVRQMAGSTGHFYFAPSTPEGQRRRDALADSLYSKGIR